MLNRIKSNLRRFRRDDEGAMVVEAMLMFPVLFGAVISTFVFFDAFRAQSNALKAAYTVSDAISRETDNISNTYINNTWSLHRFLTNSTSLTGLRITLVQYDLDEDAYNVVWSVEKGGAGTMNDSGLSAMVSDDEIPVMPDGEALIVVQTWVNYTPNFSIGLDSFTFENMIFTRPRFAPNGICYSYNDDNNDRQCPVGS